MRLLFLLVGWAAWGYLLWNARYAIARDARRFSVLPIVGLLWRAPWWRWGRSDKGATL